MSSNEKPEDNPWDAKTSETFEKYAPLALPSIQHTVATPDSSADFDLPSKRPGEYFDPCQEAASRSLKCLHRNGGDRQMCTDYFQYVGTHLDSTTYEANWPSRAYRDCKKQWVSLYFFLLCVCHIICWTLLPMQKTSYQSRAWPLES